MSRATTALLLSILFVSRSLAAAEPLPIVSGVELQPLAAQVKRVAQALELVGSPLGRGAASGARQGAGRAPTPPQAIKQIQAVLDPLVPGRREHQSRKPREGGRRAGRAEAGAAGLARVSGQGAQRGGRDGRACVSQPQRRAAVQAVDRQPRAAGHDQAARSRRALARRGDVRRPAARTRRSRACRSSTASSSSTAATSAARGEAHLRRRAGDAGPRLSQRGERAVRLRAGRRSDARSARRRRHSRRPGSS